MIDELIEILKKELKDQEKEKIEEIERLYSEEMEFSLNEYKKEASKKSYISTFIFLEDKQDKTLFDYLKIHFSKKYKRKANRERETILFFNQQDEERVKILYEEYNQKRLSLGSEKSEKISKVRRETIELLSMLGNRNYAIKKIIEIKPNLLENEDFIIELIKIDYNYIIYDKTNSPRVYEVLFQIFIDLLKKKLVGVPEFEIDKKIVDGKVINEKKRVNPGYVDLNDWIDKLNKLIDELKNPRQPEPGKYKIPHKYLFESFRKRIYNNMGVKSDANSLVGMYLDLDCSSTIEFGGMIEKLYEDSNSTLYGHQIWAGYGSKISTINSIFYEGLQMNYNNDMTRTTLSSKSSFCDLGYFLQHTDPLILLSIPNNEVEVFGCDEEKRPVYDKPSWAQPLRTYILPKYVIGAVNGKNGIEELKTEFIKNDIPVADRKKYKYFSGINRDYCDFESQLSSHHR